MSQALCGGSLYFRRPVSGPLKTAKVELRAGLICGALSAILFLGAQLVPVGKYVLTFMELGYSFVMLAMGAVFQQYLKRDKEHLSDPTVMHLSLLGVLGSIVCIGFCCIVFTTKVATRLSIVDDALEHNQVSIADVVNQMSQRVASPEGETRLSLVTGSKPLPPAAQIHASFLAFMIATISMYIFGHLLSRCLDARIRRVAEARGSKAKGK